MPGSKSIYHAFTGRLDKRFSGGLSLLTAYTFGQLRDDASTTVGFLGQAGAQQNAYDRASDWSISSQDIRHRFVTSFVYDLPFGTGRRFGNDWNGAVNAVLGGWQVNGILTFQSGIPLIITQAVNNTNLFSPTQRPTWNGQDPNIDGSSVTQGRAHPAAGSTPASFSVTPAFQFGNVPRVQPDLRADGVKNLDLSVFKNNYFHGGKWNAQVRLEMFNALNRVQFGAPNTQVGNGNFGIVIVAGERPASSAARAQADLLNVAGEEHPAAGTRHGRVRSPLWSASHGSECRRGFAL